MSLQEQIDKIRAKNPEAERGRIASLSVPIISFKDAKQGAKLGPKRAREYGYRPGDFVPLVYQYEERRFVLYIQLGEKAPEQVST